MAVWRVILTLSATLLPTRQLLVLMRQGIRPQSHTQNTTRNEAKLTIQQLRVTLLVDTKVNAILDLHVTTTRKHDSQIAPSLIKRNPEDIDILLGDKGYDDHKIRRLARQYEIRPLIKHREFTPLHKAWNARLDADLYGQRSQSETVSYSTSSESTVHSSAHGTGGNSSVNSLSPVSVTQY